MKIQAEILKYIIEGWKEYFGGTSALVLANFFNRPHYKVIAIIKALSNKDLVHFRQNTIYQVQFGPYGKIGKQKKINTIFAFPARKVLEKFLKKMERIMVFLQINYIKEILRYANTFSIKMFSINT